MSDAHGSHSRGSCTTTSIISSPSFIIGSIPDVVAQELHEIMVCQARILCDELLLIGIKVLGTWIIVMKKIGDWYNGWGRQIEIITKPLFALLP